MIALVIAVAAIFIWCPRTNIVVTVNHIADGINSDPIQVVIINPKLGTRNQKGLNLIFAKIEI